MEGDTRQMRDALAELAAKDGHLSAKGAGIAGRERALAAASARLADEEAAFKERRLAFMLGMKANLGKLEEAKRRVDADAAASKARAAAADRVRDLSLIHI